MVVMEALVVNQQPQFKMFQPKLKQSYQKRASLGGRNALLFQRVSERADKCLSDPIFSLVSEFISKKFNKKAASTDLIEPFVSDSDDQSDDDEIGADIPKWMQRIDTRMEEYKDFYLMSSTMTKLTEEYRPMIAELKGEDYYCIQNPLFGLDDKSTKLSDDLLTYYDSISRPEEDDLDPNLAVHVSLLQAAQASTQNSAGSKTKKRLSLFFKN